MISIILVIFPFLLYLVFLVVENVVDVKGKNIFFILSIFTSIYLIIKYNYDINSIKVIILLLLLKYIKINKYYLILIFLIINLIININDSINTLIYTLISYILEITMVKIEKIIDVHKVVKEVEYEKNMRESLFKITHEIKNPIAVVKGYLDMLDTSNKSQVERYIPIIKEEVERSIMLMNDFLSLTKLDVKKENMDLSVLLDDVIDEFRVILEEKNINFNYNLIDDEILILGDYDRLKQVFINVIKNSIEANAKNINIDVLIDKDIIIKVIDDGVGIMDINRVGEAFYTTKKNGTGLGVKMCKEIISSHSGSINYIKREIGTEVLIKIKKLKRA